MSFWISSRVAVIKPRGRIGHGPHSDSRPIIRRTRLDRLLFTLRHPVRIAHLPIPIRHLPPTRLSTDFGGHAHSRDKRDGREGFAAEAVSRQGVEVGEGGDLGGGETFAEEWEVEFLPRTRKRND